MKTKILNFGLLLLFEVFLSTATMAQQMAHKANATRAFDLTPAGSNDNTLSGISDTDIPATTVSHNYRDVNMDRYITLTVTNGEDISLDLAADAANTPVKIVSGDEVHDVTIGINWTGYTDYRAGATTMTIYGDIREFDCSDNGDKITGLDASQNTALTCLLCYDNQLESLDVSHNTALTDLSCVNNQLTSLDVSGATALKTLGCFGNPFTTEAVDNIFCSLPERDASDKGILYILNNTSDDNYDNVIASNKQNAINKNWNVWYWDDYNGSLNNTDIPTTTGDYECSSGISDMAADNVELYPNPVHDVLHIELSENNFGVELYNMFGQKVLHVQNEREISVSKLASGIYMLKITTEKGIYSRKIVKE